MNAVVGDDRPERGEAVAVALARAGVDVRAVSSSYGDTIDACLNHRPDVILLAADCAGCRAIIAFTEVTDGSRVILYGAGSGAADALPARVWAVVPEGASDGELVAAVWSARRSRLAAERPDADADADADPALAAT